MRLFKQIEDDDKDYNCSNDDVVYIEENDEDFDVSHTFSAV